MNITIPKPCAENWNQMTLSEQGRFCASCQTQVINFKGKSVEEIKSFLEQQTGSSCGRFSKDQIERFNATYQELPSPSNLRKWTMAAVLAGIVTLPTFAQNSNPTLPAPLQKRNVSYSHYKGEKTEIPVAVPTGDTIILAGKVIDKQANEGLPFASIIIVGTDIGTSTDIDGKFFLKVPKSKQEIILEVHYVGYPNLSYPIVPDSNKTDLVLNIEEDDLIMGNMIGVMVISRKEAKAYQRAHRKELRAERKRSKKDKGSKKRS